MEIPAQVPAYKYTIHVTKFRMVSGHFPDLSYDIDFGKEETEDEEALQTAKEIFKVMMYTTQKEQGLRVTLWKGSRRLGEFFSPNLLPNTGETFS